MAYLKQINTPFGSFNCPRRANATSASCHPAHPCTIFMGTCGEQVYCLYVLIHCMDARIVNMRNAQTDIVLVTVNVRNCTSPAECTGHHGTKTEGSHDKRGPLAEREGVCLNKDISLITPAPLSVWVKLWGREGVKNTSLWKVMKPNGLSSSSSILTTSWNYVKAIAACKKREREKKNYRAF